MYVRQEAQCKMQLDADAFTMRLTLTFNLLRLWLLMQAAPGTAYEMPSVCGENYRVEADVQT